VQATLEQVADEMGYTLVRTGRSTIITEIKDISCVITDANGQTVAQAHHTPSLLAGFEITMRELVKEYKPWDLAPGDVIVTNDPYTGGQHIMDLYAIAPVFHKGELIGFVGKLRTIPISAASPPAAWRAASARSTSKACACPS
jgi:N-methylhydantoinase B